MDEAAVWRAAAEAMREAAEKAVLAISLRCLEAADQASKWGDMGRVAALREVVRNLDRSASAIRALPLPEPPASLTASGWSYRG